MSKTRRLLRREITYSSAKEKETNVLHTLGYWAQRAKFFDHLYCNRNLIQAVAAHHLNLNPKACYIADQDEWIHGSFNLCIPITVRDWKGHSGQRFIIRFPLPYRVGEAFRPGNADEKLRCEAGTYTWLQENCPSVPIPHLYGFGLSTGQSFTALEHLPLFPRCLQYLRRQVMALIGHRLPSRYVCRRNQTVNLATLGTGYLLIEFIEKSQGCMLSNTWDENRHDPKLQKNLFRDLSRILLTLARIPLPQIGSFIIDDEGVLSLKNRPLTLEIQDLENEQIPTNIPRNFTYSTVDSFIVDTLSFHDSRLLHQPNAVTSVEDCVFQMSALTVMKTIFTHFFQRDLRRGPFVFSFTDLHQSNIFVDENWNIKCLVDLEWACSLPIEMQHPPYWLTSQPVDGINLEQYDRLHKDFMDVLVEEERDSFAGAQGVHLSSIMKRGWEMGTFWYSLALQSPTGLFSLFYDHIQPKFAKGHTEEEAFFRLTMDYWSINAKKIRDAKIKDKQDYDIQLREAFA